MQRADIEKVVRESGLPPDRVQEFEQDLAVYQTVAALAGWDADAGIADLWDRLPDVRKARAAQLRQSARNLAPADRDAQMQQADRLRKSAQKLDSPDPEQLRKARAFAVELSAQVSLQLRDIDFSHYCPSPETVEAFRRAHGSAVHDLVEQAGLPQEQARMVANRQVAQSIAVSRQGGRGLQDGIQDFIAAQHHVHKIESGHLHDVSVHDETASVPQLDGTIKTVEEVLSSLSGEQDVEDRRASRRLIERLRESAAEHLNDRQYVIFRVLMDEGHGIHFARKDRSITAEKATGQGVEMGDFPANFVMRALPGVYHGRGSAHRAVEATLTNLSGILLRNQEPELSEKARERLVSDTRTMVRAEQAKSPQRKEEARRKGVELE